MCQFGTASAIPAAHRSWLRKATARSGAWLGYDHRESRPVKPAPFTYHRPETLAEALRLLAELAPQDGRILAGGQSLVPIMAFRLACPVHLIDINAVAGLDVLAASDGALHIGARVRHAAFHHPVQDGPLG